jgi:3-hydroxymyristoyl/3-hydroxydecanoyl-(acyl carrier protein) dehydratase
MTEAVTPATDTIGIDEILARIPHRYPFLFVDRSCPGC